MTGATAEEMASIGGMTEEEARATLRELAAGAWRSGSRSARARPEP